MTTTTCPSREVFLQCSLGLISEEESHSLAEHLESCPECQDLVMTLDNADDTLVGRLRMPLSSESFLAEPQLQRALSAAAGMPMPRADAVEGADLAADMPETLGEYRLLEELGRGGMGRVYKALHTKLDRVVALKILSRGRVGDRQAIGRFEREMKAVGRLVHPNIVQAYDAREIGDTPVLVMEFVDGLDLAELVRRVGAVPVPAACELVRRTALALECAHEHGLVHRDIKPSNIMLTAPLARSGRGAGGEGISAEVKLLDLGLARFYAEGGTGVPSSGGEEMTGTGQPMGTADYMAPEQASDSRTVDIRADLYSLGCTLYKLLSGRAPFSGRQFASALDKMNAHVQQAVPPIRDLAREVPDELAAILERMLAKDPAARFAAPAVAAAALAPFCQGANLNDLIVRAMASESPLSLGENAPSGPLSLRESVSTGPLALRERARVRAEDSQSGNNPDRQPAAAAIRRRAIVRRILIGLAFLGAIAAGFAAGIVITINKDGRSYKLNVPDNAETTIDKNGNATIQVPSKPDGAAPAASPAADLRALQGKWRVVRVEKGADADQSWAAIWGWGSPLDPSLVHSLEFGKCWYETEKKADGLIQILDARFISPSPPRASDQEPYLPYRIDPTATPKTIDFNGFGNREQVAALGIYEIAGDQLKICLSRCVPTLKSDQRPKGFAIGPGSGDILFVLERYRPSEDETAMQGRWMITRLSIDGDRISAEKLRGREFVFDDQFMGETDGSWPYRWELFILDAGKETKSITFSGFEMNEKGGYKRDEKGNFKKHESSGIFKLDGDYLTIAFRLNAPRPEKFESTPGSGVTLMSLKRWTPDSATPPKTSTAPPKPSAAPPETAPAPPQVAVVHPIVRQITHHLDLTGQLEASQTAEIRARVTGQLAKVLFKPGAMVAKGDVLFEIDPQSYQAECYRAMANVTQAEAHFTRLEADFKRTAEVYHRQAISRAEYERASGERTEAEAALHAAQAASDIAKLALERTRVSAPISGKIGRPLVAVGSQVTESMPLATIDSVDPMCVVFNVDQNSVVNLRRNPPHLQEGSALPVLVGLSDEKDFPRKTKVESADTRIDPATGTARWRALLPNPDGLLMPGMFVHVRLVTSDPYNALLVPESAVYFNGSADPQKFVFIVTDQNVVRRRDVETGPLGDNGIKWAGREGAGGGPDGALPRNDQMMIVEKGLTADDWVIEKANYGHGSWQDGMTVKPLKPAAAPPTSSQAKPPVSNPAAELNPVEPAGDKSRK